MRLLHFLRPTQLYLIYKKGVCESNSKHETVPGRQPGILTSSLFF